MNTEPLDLRAEIETTTTFAFHRIFSNFLQQVYMDTIASLHSDSHFSSQKLKKKV